MRSSACLRSVMSRPVHTTPMTFPREFVRGTLVVRVQRLCPSGSKDSSSLLIKGVPVCMTVRSSAR